MNNHSAGLMSMRQPSRGFGLVELMVAMIIGLVVIGGAISIFGVNRQTYRTTENLGRVQENARIAFELMARDIREAAGNPCGRSIPIANTLNNPASNWWTNWGDGIFGVDSSAPGTYPVPTGWTAGTDLIEIKSGSASDGVTVRDSNANASNNSASIQLNRTDHGFQVGDILMVCDYRQAAIFQISGGAASQTIVHSTGNIPGHSPGNCTKGLGFPVPSPCTTNGRPYHYGANAIVVRLSSLRWYVADNGRGGTSLYRQFLAQAPQEIVEGVVGMQLTYIADGSAQYLPANQIGANNWRNVTGVRIALELVSPDAIGTDGGPIRRTVEHFVTLRNRVS